VSEVGRKGSAAGRKPLTWRQRLGLVAFGVALVALLEVAVRLLGVAPAARPRDPLIEGGAGEPAYAPGVLPSGEKGLVCPWVRPEFSCNFPPLPLAKPAGETRVFVFGGSSAVGYPFDGRLAFAAFLEKGLEPVLGSGRVRVVNVAQNNIPAGTCLQLMHEMAQLAPDVFVVYSGNNEYEDRHVYRRVLRRGRAVAVLRSVMGRLAIYRAVERVLMPAKMRVYEAFDLSEEAMDVAAYSAEERRAILDNYAYVLRRMADLCAERGIGLVLCTVAANAADWPPYRSVFSRPPAAQERAEWLKGLSAAAAKVEAGGCAEALKMLDELARADVGRADLHFLRGRALAGLGRGKEAAASFDRALDLDNVCYRASPSHNRIVRETAAAAAAGLADAVEALRRSAPDGLLGEGLFWDHCHPRPGAHALIALEAARAMFAAGMLPAAPSDWEARFSQAAEAWAGAAPVTPRLRAMAMRNVASGWMGLWTHHRQADDVLRNDRRYLRRALEYLDEAVRIAPTLAGARFYRGVVRAQSGDMSGAMADWRAEADLKSEDGPLRQVLAGLLDGSIPPDRGFEQWLFVRNEMMR